MISEATSRVSFNVFFLFEKGGWVSHFRTHAPVRKHTHTQHGDRMLATLKKEKVWTWPQAQNLYIRIKSAATQKKKEISVIKLNSVA